MDKQAVIIFILRVLKEDLSPKYSIMSQVILTIKRVIETGSDNFGLIVNESIKAVHYDIDNETGEMIFSEVDTNTLVINRKYLQGWLNSVSPGIAYLYGKRKEEGKSITATDLTVFFRDAKITVERNRYTDQDTYTDVDGEEVHYQGITWRTELIDIEFSPKVAEKIEALEDKAFEI